MKKIITITHFFVLLLFYPLAFAANTLFNITASGNQTAEPINIILCLNGKGPVSCQNYTVNQPRLTINTTVPNHTYLVAGIKISSSKVPVMNLEGCVAYTNGYCLFTVSNSQPANIFINNPTTTPIVFMSQTQTPGDMSNNPQSLTGLAGANALCNEDAQSYGTPAVKAHANYVALLITANSTPCSQINSINGCAGAYASPLWPLKPGVTYFNPDGVTPFNTVTANAIFPDTSPQGALYPDLRYPDGSTPSVATPFWFGPQSIYMTGTSDPTAITGWAYANLANSSQYLANFALCSDQGAWTSQAGFVFGAYGQTANPFHCSQNPCGTPNIWQNYYSDDQGGAESDTFSASNYNACNTMQNILCVSSP